MKRFILFLMLFLVMAFPATDKVFSAGKVYTSTVGENWHITGADLSNCTGLTGNTWIETLIRLPGDIFYVDSGATGAGTGLSWTDAVTTVQATTALTTANNGDLVLAAPGHAETIGGAKAIDLDIAGVEYRSVGTGQDAATFSYDTNVDSIAFGADGDGTKLIGFRFIATVTAVANAIIVEAGCTDFVIEGCVFENETTTVDEFIDAILVSGTASDRGIIRYNRFLGDPGANAGPKSSINFVDCDYLQVYGNEFSGDIGDAHIFNETTASNFITIRDNSIICGYIGDAETVLDTTPGISLVATTTGWIQDNFVVTNVATPDLAIVAADCYLDGNTHNKLQGGAFASSSVGLVPGQTYVVQIADVAVGDEDLFLVAGGEILITNLVGEVTTVFATSAATSKISINATDAGLDYDFSTAVDLTDAVDGGRFIFTNANLAVLTPLALATTGSTSLMNPWYCVPGMIEVIDSDDNDSTGATTWVMTFIPLAQGVTVTPQ